MQLDPTGEFIAHISRACDIDDKALLEIGCGSGRITRDLAARARTVVAIDPNERALGRARAAVTAANVSFAHGAAEAVELPRASFDAAVFSLSLHHIPRESMGRSLARADECLRADGRIVVIEPGDHGTLIEAEERFGVGDGDERAAKAWAQRALEGLAGWTVASTHAFRTLFLFDGPEDFSEHLPPLPGRPRDPGLIPFLERYRDGDRVVLWADRLMKVLARG